MTPAAWLGLRIGAGVLIVALSGMAATDLGPWYQSLIQPAWKPPDAWFGPAWTFIYLCAGWSAYRGLRTAAYAGGTPYTWLKRAWIVNGGLNIAWSWLFFGLKRPTLALIEVALLWLSIAVLMVLTRRVDGRAAGWLWPYLLWVGFAAALNAAVVTLNRSSQVLA
jgi:translocator protein